ncbi:Uncharacterised protein [Legionella donaldsonii]|uniref:Uncharacterized protein n=1 Tax=Legionella donaldsonii TaxID=45060 RepID=A0A378J334_9GAMM|nr:hypothetical protein [Legionella donaldsonii]STX41919.1 Uncharacterised protein [Legionella donaldsonii]
MKTFALLILFLFSFQAEAVTACRCTCDLSDRRLCASTIFLDQPCPGICPSQSPEAPPMGNTACPTSKVFNANKNTYEWVAICPD